ncbi:MAG: class I SAM-dependent methyltransferase [Coriobacteriia bacterium]
MHSSATPDTEGLLVHWSRPYDVVLGRFIRRTDAPIMALAEVGTGDRVLDVATGPGYLAHAAAGIVGPTGTAVGIDASPEMIDRATETAASASHSATFILAGAQKLPFEDEAFDVVVSRLAMHHLPGDIKNRALAEIHRVLAPGGRVLIADLATHSLVELLHDVIGHGSSRVNETDNPLVDLVRQVGFETVTVGSIGILRYVKAAKAGATP